MEMRRLGVVRLADNGKVDFLLLCLLLLRNTLFDFLLLSSTSRIYGVMKTYK